MMIEILTEMTEMIIIVMVVVTVMTVMAMMKCEDDSDFDNDDCNGYDSDGGGDSNYDEMMTVINTLPLRRQCRH